MANDLGFYLIEGAALLRNVPLAYASDGSDYKFDAAYWEVQGRSKGADILVLKPNKSPAEAVLKIFSHTGRWQFDCSQFCQVVNYYAWLKVLGPAKFDNKVHSSHIGLRIKPFQGAIFTARRHYYRRELRSQWMKYYPNGDQSKPGQQTCLKAWEIVRAAPIGSRVNFTNDRAADPTWRFENTIKVGTDQFAAHGLRVPSRNVFPAQQLLTWIYRRGADKPAADLNEARQYVWIKEVEYHVHVPHPVSCAP